MKHLRVVLGLTLIPLCAFLGSFVSVGAGSGAIIGFFLGVVLSYFFLTYGSSHKNSRLSTSYYLNQHHQVNGGITRQAADINGMTPLVGEEKRRT